MGLSEDSIPTIDQKLNDLVYTVTAETDEEIQKYLHNSKGLGGLTWQCYYSLFILTVTKP